MHSLNPIEPFCLVEMRAGNRIVPPFVAIGTTNEQDAERQALAFARDRFETDDDIVVSSIQCVGGGRASTVRR